DGLTLHQFFERAAGTPRSAVVFGEQPEHLLAAGIDVETCEKRIDVPAKHDTPRRISPFSLVTDAVRKALGPCRFARELRACLLQNAARESPPSIVNSRRRRSTMPAVFTGADEQQRLVEIAADGVLPILILVAL